MIKIRNRLFAGTMSFVLALGMGGALTYGVVKGTTIISEAADQVNVYRVDDFYYTVTDANEVTLLRYYGSNSSVVFPNTIEGKKVTRVVKDVFGEGASSIKSITIPSNIEVIEEGAFRYCIQLEQINCSSNKYFNFSSGMLYYTKEVTKGFYVGLLGTISKYDEAGEQVEMPEGYDTMETPDITVKKTLLCCTKDNQQISIPDGVDAIGAYAFYNYSEYRVKLNSVTLPTSIKYIGDHAFYGCESLSVMSSTQTDEGGSNFNIPYETVYIGDFAFKSCSSIRSLNLPENLWGVGACAFLHCGKLKQVYVPDNVKWLGTWSFGYLYGDYVESVMEIYASSLTKVKDFLLMSKVQVIDENGDYSVAAQYANDQNMNYVDEETYQNSDLDEDGNHTGNHTYVGAGGEIISYDTVRTHDPNNDFDHEYAYTAMVAPTCTTPGGAAGICYCGHSFFYEYPAYGHAYFPTVVPPTCTEDGYTAYICARCGDELIDELHPKTDITEPTGHSYVDFVTEPTYRENGYTEHICERCGDSYIDNVTDKLECTAHEFTYVETVKATCTTEGERKGTCSKCGYEVTERTDKAAHRYSWEDTTPATCTEDGVRTYTCEDCGDNYTEKLDRIGHNYVGTVTTEPTCKATGVKTFTCTKCHDSYTETIAKKKHTYVDTVVEPTATEGGYTEHVCSACGYSYKDDFTSRLVDVLEDGDFEYVVEVDGTAWLVNYTGNEAGTLTVPSKLGGKNVTKIEPLYDAPSYDYEPFSDAENSYFGPKKIVLPSTLKQIGDYAFAFCENLESIEIPNSVVHIGCYAFCACKKLQTLVIPDSVETMDMETFDSCVSLTSITLSKKLKEIPQGCFIGCEGLTEVTIPDSVTAIGGDAFMYTGLKSITIPKSVKTIGGDGRDNPIGFAYDTNGNLIPIQGFMIYCYKDTAGQAYAIENGIAYTLLEDVPVIPDGWSKDAAGKWYYYEGGKAVTGWKTIKNKWYYFSPATATLGQMQTGWQQLSKKWYYFNASGEMQTGWQQIGKKWYYFNASGEMLTGWQQIGKKWYYFNASGEMLTGWKQLSKKWYYFNANGEMLTGWQQISKKWYYFNASGEMLTGWQTISKKWYYFNTGGEMLTGWQTISKKTYFFKTDGSMAAGEYCKGYRLNSDGTWTYKAKASWKQNKNGWYFSDTQGWYAKNCTLTIDGKKYTFDARGYKK